MVVSSRFSPVVQDGRMFVNAGTKVYALNARTGELLWSYATNSAPGSNETTAGLIDAWKSANGIPNGQGVTAAENMVFVGLMDGRLVALDQGHWQDAMERAGRRGSALR
jgi:outer membrane protein assembly factor BamB